MRLLPVADRADLIAAARRGCHAHILRGGADLAICLNEADRDVAQVTREGGSRRVRAGSTSGARLADDVRAAAFRRASRASMRDDSMVLRDRCAEAGDAQ